jgi:hypothetical protein
MSRLCIAALATATLGVSVLSPPASAAVFNGKTTAELQKSAGPGNALQRVQRVIYRTRTVYVYRPYRRRVYRPYRVVRPYVLAHPAYYGYAGYPSVGVDVGFGGVGLGYGGYALAYPTTGYYAAPYYAGYPGYVFP